MKKVIMMFLTFSLVIGLFAGCGNNESKDATGTDAAGTDAAVNENGESTGETDETGEEAPTNKDPENFNDEVVFEVGEHDIMLSRVNFLLYQIKSYYETYYGPTVWDMQATEDQTVEEFVRNDIKNVSVRLAVVEDMAAEKGIELTEEEIQSYKEQANQFFNTLDQEAIDKYGLSHETIEALILSQGLSQKVYEEETADFEYDKDRVQSELEADEKYQAIMDAGVDHYYDTVTARHILIKTVDDSGQPLSDEEKAEARAKIEDLLEQAKNGADFAELATENTEDPGSADKGGEYTFGRGKMVPEFEEAAFGLEEGEISDVIETSYGYHIIKLETKNASTDDQIAQAEQDIENIRQSLIDKQRMEEFDSIYQDYLDANYTVTVNDDVWATISVRDEEAADDATADEATTDETTKEESTDNTSADDAATDAAE